MAIISVPGVSSLGYEGGPKNNWNLSVALELEVVARCAARCRESTQYSKQSTAWRQSRLTVIVVAAYFSKCLLGSSAIFMMTDSKEQRVCVKFCFLLGKSAAETVLMLQEALSKTQVYEWY